MAAFPHILRRYPILIIAVLFFVFGSVSWLNAILIPYLKIACELNNLESYLVASAFYLSYFLLAIPSSFILQRTGFRRGMVLGLFLIGTGALFFIPAALSRTYAVFLMGLFIQGAGLTLLQTAANPYVTILGPLESAARRISIMGVCNKIAGAICPLLLGFFILDGADELTASLQKLDATAQAARLDALARQVIGPYLLIASILFLLSWGIARSPLPEVEQSAEAEAPALKKTGILKFPHLLLGALAIFLYVGVEKISGFTVIAYGNSQGIPLSEGKFFPSLILAGMIAGYFLGIALIPRVLSQKRALLLCAASGLLFTLAALSTTGLTSVLFICLLGLANALIWPSVWPLAIDGLGAYTKLGSSILVLGIFGGAVLPLLYGWLADQWNPRQAYWLMIPCYAYFAYYALSGHKRRRG